MRLANGCVVVEGDAATSERLGVDVGLEEQVVGGWN